MKSMRCEESDDMSWSCGGNSERRNVCYMKGPDEAMTRKWWDGDSPSKGKSCKKFHE